MTARNASTAPPPGRIRVGISGWRYAPWRRVFYPPGLPQREELAHASRRFATLEINGTFYSLQDPQSWRAWHAATPDDFLFAVKGPRYVTHHLRLREAERPLANFFGQGLLTLGQKLGPLLWQLPPNHAFDAARLSDFLDLLPRTVAQACGLARRADERLGHPPALEGAVDAPLRHALEVRHPSFVAPRFIALLRAKGIGLCISDGAGSWPLIEDLTADFVYLRLHGKTRLYASGYNAASLAHWAQRIRRWSAGEAVTDAQRAGADRAMPPCDVYAYFDNDAKVRAPFDALNLEALLRGQRPVPFPRAALAASQQKAGLNARGIQAGR